MSSIMTKRGNQDNIVTYEFVCDTTADLQTIEPQYVTMGSVATVIQGETGFEVYMANSQKEWVNIGGGGSNNSGSSEPVWVNQDIITNIPEKVFYSEDDDDSAMQSNIQLNNHTIIGNITPTYSNPDYAQGILMIEIDPAILSSFVTSNNYRNLNPSEEYYVMSLVAHFSEDSELYTEFGDIGIISNRIEDLSESNIIGYNAGILVMSDTDTLNIYKLPGGVASEVTSQLSIMTASYALSKTIPEATYDISQLTYETPQAGE